MRTKIIPFDDKIAKDIQDGKIEGKIKTKCGNEVRILCFDLIDPRDVSFPIVCALYSDKNVRVVRFTECGRYSGDINSELDLVLEVPDNEPMFNVGDTVSINIINSSYDADFRARYHSKLATVLFINKYGAGVKTIISGDENYFPFNELIFMRRDAKEPQFEPFDKVLMRSPSSGYMCWYPHFYSRYIPDAKDKKPHVALDGFGYEECIPYEGNESLVGTTDNPKEE